MAETDFDTLLHRTIKDGKEFESLIPYTTCERIGGGTGNTDYSISQIKKIAIEFNYQTEKIAKVLRGGTLERDVAAIKDFLYDHFQYKADKKDQMMRAPSCSFFDRATGIDCKSYSIFASCLLINMGYIHYIRKIRQQAPEYFSPEEKQMFESGFSHVYVIVPLDQKNGTLNQGYYCIDGTIATDNELNFLEAKDIIMNFPHHVLLGSVVQENGYSYQDLTPLNGGGISLSGLKDLSKSFSINTIKSVWSKIGCWGGSSLTEAGLVEYAANIDKFYQDWVFRFNSSIVADDTQLTSYLVAEFKGKTAVFLDSSRRNKGRDWNSCTKDRIEAAVKAFVFYQDVVGAVLDGFMMEYFNPVAGTFPQSSVFTSENSETIYGFRHQNMSPPSTSTQPKQLYVPDLTVTIPAFDLPKYVIDQTNSGQPINMDTVLNLMETAGNIVKTVSPSSGNNSGSNTGSNSGSNTPIKNTPVKNVPVKGGGTFTPIKAGQLSVTKTAGFGWVAGGLLLAGAAAVAFSKMKDEPIKKIKE